MRDRYPDPIGTSVDDDITEIEQDIRPPVRRRLVQGLVAALILTTIAALIVAKIMSDQKAEAVATAVKAIGAQATAEAQLTATPAPGTGLQVIVPVTVIPDASPAGQTRSVQLAYAALQQLDVDPEASVQVAMAANQAGRTAEAEDALRRSLAASHIRLRLRDLQSPIRTAMFSPDGDVILTTHAAGGARVWDAQTGALRFVLSHGDARVLSAAFSPDRESIVTTSIDKTVCLWSAADGMLLATMSGHAADVTAVRFSPDGSRIATGGADSTVRIWVKGAVTSTLVLSGQIGLIEHIEWTTDGGRVLAVGQQGATVWDMHTGRLLFRADNAPSKTTLFDAHFSPDGKLLVATGSSPVRLLDATTGLVARTFTTVTDFAQFSPDSTMLLAGGTLWNLSTSQVIHVFPHIPYTPVLLGYGVWTVLMLIDPQTLAVWSLVPGNSTDLYSQAIKLRSTSTVLDYTVSADGQSIVSVEANGTASIWSVAPETLPQDYAALLNLANARIQSLHPLSCAQHRTLLGENLVCPTPTPLRT